MPGSLQPVGAMVSVNDFAPRPARGMTEDEVLETGKYRFRFISTPHLPHCWEAATMFEETNGTLFCSDLFHQNGDNPPFTTSEVMDKVRKTLVDYQASPLANYMPYRTRTEANINKLAALGPKTFVPMHGSAYGGDGEKAIRDLAVVMREVLASGLDFASKVRQEEFQCHKDAQKAQ